MSKTFFISSSSHEDQRPIVQALAKRLKQKFGWRWYFDWTQGFEEENNYPRHELIHRATQDLAASVDADIFIWLESPVISLGSNREFGARIGTGRRVYRISDKPLHIFDMLDMLVVTLETTDELLKVLEKREYR